MYEYNVPKPVTMSGSKEGNLPLVIEDAEQMAFGGLSVYGKSTQDGTPSPESPVPIEIPGSDGSVDVNLTGGNLLPFPYYDGNSKSENGITFTVNKDGSILVNGTATNITYFYITKSFNFGIYQDKYISAYAPDLNGSVSTSNITLRIGKNTNNTSIQEIFSNNTIIKQSNESSAFLGIRVSKGYTVENILIKPAIYIKNDYDYNQYIATNIIQSLPITTPNGFPGIPVDSDGNYTDETGQQWISDVKDYETGKYTQNIGKISSYNSEDVGDIWLSSTGELSSGATVIYILNTPIVTDISAEEMAAYRKLHANSPTTVISSDEDIYVKAKYYKRVQEPSNVNPIIFEW